MRPEVAQAEDAVQARAESNLSWHLHRMDTAWAKSVRPRIAHAPDRYFANGNLAPGVLMRHGCQWYRERVEPAQYRNGGHLIGFHFVFGKNSKAGSGFVDMAAANERHVCISFSRTSRGVLLRSAASDVCGGPAALTPTNHSSSESAAAMRVTRSTTSDSAAEQPATDRPTSRLTTHFPSKMISSRSFAASRPLLVTRSEFVQVPMKVHQSGSRG